MSVAEFPEHTFRWYDLEPESAVVVLTRQIKEGRFTKEELKLRGNDAIQPGFSVTEFIEACFDFGGVHWDGDVLRLGK